MFINSSAAKRKKQIISRDAPFNRMEGVIDPAELATIFTH